MSRGKSIAEDGSIRLQVVELRTLSDVYGSGATVFEPSNGIEKRDSSNANSSVAPIQAQAPEKKLTLFAMRLAVFEKAATGLGTLGFIWATVVLLGGFAITLEKTDFWFITIILLIEGTRIFSRSRELEWQQQATWSINSFRALRSSSHSLVKAVKEKLMALTWTGKQRQRSRDIRDQPHGEHWDHNYQRKPTRTWTSSDVPMFPYGQWFFDSSNISKLLYWLQLASATVCVVLSLMKLIRRDYGEVAAGDTDKRNRKSALTIFYGLALAEALLFLMEKAYWEWKVIGMKLLDEVNNECKLGPSGIVSIRRFFYDAYSRSINGSIFDGLKMDMVTFAMELLDSDSSDEQLIGIRILRQLASNERFSDDTLRKIGTSITAIERLVEMLNWKDLPEEEIRRSAAEILSQLAGKKQNSLRVAGIPGAVESISSLLQTNRTSTACADEIGEKKIIFDRENYGFWAFNHLGLQILKKLARDHDNCGKIGNTRGLLPKIIDFTHAGERLLKDENISASQILTVKRSLQVVNMLASTTGETGKHLRKEISEVVFTISNIRDILRHGEKHPILQRIGIEILTNLAQEEEATERIGGTGGVLKELFNIFFNRSEPEVPNHARTAAGKALAMLALGSSGNCHRILNLHTLERLLRALADPSLCVNAARILRNLCAYSGEDCFDKLKGVTVSAPVVLNAIVTDDQKLQEVMIGLAAQVFKFMTSEESMTMFERAGMTEAGLARVLVQILNQHVNPSIKVPRIRRFAIELAIWMMRNNEENIVLFRNLGLENKLEDVLETTAEVESFIVFSGTVGLCRHSTTIHSLVETALQLLHHK